MLLPIAFLLDDPAKVEEVLPLSFYHMFPLLWGLKSTNVLENSPHTIAEGFECLSVVLYPHDMQKNHLGSF